MRNSFSFRSALAGGFIAAVVVAPLTAIATHSFTDVPASYTFHSDIEWLKNAGVTKGCNPPDNTRFCPDDPVTRGQMSAFMRRLAENRVVDADTLDGKHASEFALTSDLPTQGGASCAGVGFIPTEEDIPYQGQTPRTSTSGASYSFLCSLSLPHGATMTSFTASLNDTAASTGGFCRLWRVDVTGGTFGLGNGDELLLATTTSTTGSFGDQTVTTTDIDHAVVNARRYAYYAACSAGSGSNLGINGVVVRFDLP